MITDLTQFYRLSLRKSGDRILIRDELEIARLYLNMEKLCHNETLSWEIHAEDGIENFLILPLYSPAVSGKLYSSRLLPDDSDHPHHRRCHIR